MSRPTLTRALTLAGLAALAAALTGCGKTGELQRPAPLFGSAMGPAAESNRAYDPSRPINTFDPRDQAIDPGPDGASPLPPATPAPDAAATPDSNQRR